jgi:predicted metalloprotease
MDERERIVEVEREPVVERHTTVVSTGGDRGGGGGTIIAVLVLIVAVIVLFLMFGRGLIGGSEKTDINVDIKTPELPTTAPSK